MTEAENRTRANNASVDAAAASKLVSNRSNWLIGGGEMGDLIRSLDWSQTPLGEPSTWPQSLRTSLSICLASRFPILIWWGAELVMLYNDAYRPILGATKHPRSMGQCGRECWAEIWDVIGPMLEGVLATGEATWSDDQLLLMNRNGYVEECYFTFSYSPIRDEAGQVGGIFTAVTETTAQVLDQRRLQTLGELASITAEARTIQSACQRILATLGHNPYDVPFALLYLVEDNGKQARLAGTVGIESGTLASPSQVDLQQPSEGWRLVQVCQTGQAHVVENLQARFGSAIPAGVWLEVPSMALVMPIVQSGQEQLEALLVLGLSPQRQFDQDYRRFCDLVANNVSAAIASARAYQTERQRAEVLAELDRAKTTFFSNVSHEFRTPLTLMLGPLEDALANLDIAETEPAAPAFLLAQINSTKQQLQTVQRNSLRLLKLVNMLLDFSRLEAGRIQAVYEPVDLSTFTIELASGFRSALERVGLHLNVDCPALPEPVYVDREMWEKIVLNLLSNAFKFTFEGEIIVRLRWEDREDEEDREDGEDNASPSSFAVLEIRDTGIGIPATELPHLFERFYRVPGARGRTFEGSGVGLSLVQELVKLHGGTITVTSQVEQGSCFVISIPTGSAHLPPERINAARSLTSTATGAPLYIEEALHWLPPEMAEIEAPPEITSNRTPIPQLDQSARILLADDNADMRAYIKRLLEQRYQVEAVTDGMAALAAIQQQVPDLVLTDVMMPRLDGFALLQALRADPATQSIPVILLSARAGEASRIEGLTAGADDYLIKPFSAQELLARIEASLKLSQLRQVAQQREQTLRLEAEAAEMRLQTVLASLQDDFVVLDSNWRITYLNDHAAKTLNHDRQAAIGHTIWHIAPDLVQTEFHNQLQQAMRERKPILFEHYDQKWHRWFENRVYPAADGIINIGVDITERKAVEAEREQAEIALQQSEERFRLATMAVDGLVFDWDLRTDYTYRSAKLYELIGVHPDDAPPNSQWWIERIHPDDFTRLQPQLLGLLRGSDVLHESEYRVRHEDGNWVDVWERSCLLRDQDGQVIRIVGSTVDITERKRIEDQLRQQALIVEYLQDGVIVTDADAQIVGFNPAAERLTGYSRAEAIGQSTKLWYRPEELATRTQALLESIRETGIWQGELTLVRKDGSEALAEVTIVGVLDQDGNLLRTIGLNRDITERKQVEIALQESEQRLQLALEAARTVAWQWRAMDNQVILSATQMEVLGILPSQLVVEGIEEIFGEANAESEVGHQVTNQLISYIHFDDVTAYQKTIDNAKPNGTYKAQFRWIRPDNGQIVWLEDRGRVYSDASGDGSGKVVKISGILIDISDRVRLEQERDQLLQREQAAREAAEQANRIKDEFLAVLSHELRTPLNPILGWSRLLSSGNLDTSKTAYALATIERNAKLQVQLIDDLLDISRILRGKLSLTVTLVDLRTVITAALETVRLAADAKAIKLQFDVQDDWSTASLANPPSEADDGKSRTQVSSTFRVNGDAGRLQQVVWNLLSNAVKFTPSSGQIRITLSQVNADAQIQVTDTGKGIRAEFLPYVFEHFRQEDGATTRQFGGLGLGLAIVRQIVELHGGRVSVTSPGERQGATFTVQIPLARQPIVLPDSEPVLEPPLDLQGIQVLVVDDEPDSREFVAFTLEQANATVTTVPSGIEALQSISHHIPDVVISDIGMPDMDGYMLIQQIQQRFPDRAIAVIALTAYAGETNQVQALAAGFQQHLAKPVEPVELIRAVILALGCNKL